MIAVAIVACPAVPASARADEVRQRQWHLRALDVARAHQISQGFGVTVAVIDSGVEPHVDLRGNLIPGKAFVAPQDDGRSDRSGHGTQMASLIAAHGHGSSVGVLGIAPAAKILPVRGADAEGRGDSRTTAQAIVWASTNGAAVINFSRAVAPGIELQDAVASALGGDALIVAAAGNVGQDIASAYPAAMPGVLAVGASDQAGEHADFSVAAKHVQICAPGIEMEAAKPDDRYAIGFGTSYSTAVVSGAAALVRARFPELTAPEVIHRLTATADDIGPPGRDDECGFGVLNLVAALTAEVPPMAQESASAGPAPQPGQSRDAAGEGRSGVSLPLLLGLGAVAVACGGLAAILAVRRRRR